MGLFSDIVDLAKAGWKPSDVKAILEMDQKLETSEEVQELKPVTKSEEKKETKKDSRDIDYKKKYEETEAKLAAIQIENSKEDVSKDGQPSMDEIILGIANRL